MLSIEVFDIIFILYVRNLFPCMINKLKTCQVTVNFTQGRLCSMRFSFVFVFQNVCIDQGPEPLCMAILESVSYK
jgi:hypothetical protein